MFLRDLRREKRMVNLEGEVLEVMVLKNPVDMGTGIRSFEISGKGLDGLLFVFPRGGRKGFTGKSMNVSVYLCSLKPHRKMLRKKKCVCLHPGAEVEMEGRAFLERPADAKCKRFYHISEEDS